MSASVISGMASEISILPLFQIVEFINCKINLTQDSLEGSSPFTIHH